MTETLQPNRFTTPIFARASSVTLLTATAPPARRRPYRNQAAHESLLLRQACPPPHSSVLCFPAFFAGRIRTARQLPEQMKDAAPSGQCLPRPALMLHTYMTNPPETSENETAALNTCPPPPPHKPSISIILKKGFSHISYVFTNNRTWTKNHQSPSTETPCQR